MVLHLASLRNRGLGQLWNPLLAIYKYGLGVEQETIEKKPASGQGRTWIRGRWNKNVKFYETLWNAF